LTKTKETETHGFRLFFRTGDVFSAGVFLCEGEKTHTTLKKAKFSLAEAKNEAKIISKRKKREKNFKNF